MTERPQKRKPAHLDFIPSMEDRLVYKPETGDFESPPSHFIKTIPVDLVAALYELPKSAVFTWLACWFLHGCSKGKPFTINRSTARRFGLTRQNRRRGVRALEAAGLVTVNRQPGRASVIQLVSPNTDYRRKP